MQKRLTFFSTENIEVFQIFGWLVVLGLNGPLRQYFSLCQAVSQREGKRRQK